MRHNVIWRSRIAHVNRLALESSVRGALAATNGVVRRHSIFLGFICGNRSMRSPIVSPIGETFAIARALLTVSSYSKCGSESATTRASLKVRFLVFQHRAAQRDA